MPFKIGVQIGIVRLNNILTRMKELAKSLPEYSVVRTMGGVGEYINKIINTIVRLAKFATGLFVMLKIKNTKILRICKKHLTFVSRFNTIVLNRSERTVVKGSSADLIPGRECYCFAYHGKPYELIVFVD